MAEINIVIIWGDDIGQSNISACSHGVMGYKTPNIDRVAKEGMMFTDYYAEQSCTAGRASFITGQSGLRTAHRARCQMSWSPTSTGCQPFWQSPVILEARPRAPMEKSNSGSFCLSITSLAS